MLFSSDFIFHVLQSRFLSDLFIAFKPAIGTLFGAMCFLLDLFLTRKSIAFFHYISILSRKYQVPMKVTFNLVTHSDIFWL